MWSQVLNGELIIQMGWWLRSESSDYLAIERGVVIDDNVDNVHADDDDDITIDSGAAD